MIRKLISYVVAVMLTWSTWPMATALPQQTQSGELTNEEDVNRINRAMDLVEELRTHIDRSQFDLEALLEKLNYDASEIIDFLQLEIAFQPYQGALRGARGTLMSRSGNAIDQAVLLARLLTDAGYEARVVRGKLSNNQVDYLLKTARASSTYPPPFRDSPQTREIIERMYKESLVSPKDGTNFFGSSQVLSGGRRTEVTETAEKHVTMLRDVLDYSDLDLNSDELQNSIESELTDYFWVEYRPGSGGWLPVHPVFEISSPWKGSLEPKEYYAGQIPPELQHRLRFEAYLSQRTGTRQVIHPLMQPWERPTANLNAVPLHYETVPNGFATIEEWSQEALEDAVNSSTLFFPNFNGAFPEGGMVFDSNGNVVPPEAANSYMAGLFQNLGSRLESGVNAISDTASRPESDNADLVRIEKHWVELTLISPGGAETPFKRTLINVEDKETLDRDWLGLQATFTLLTGTLPPSFIIDSVLQDVTRQTPVVRALIQASSESTVPALDPQRNDGGEPLDLTPSLFRELLFAWIVDASAASFSGADLFYRAEPSILAHYSHLWLFSEQIGGFDIVTNNRRFFSIIEDAPQYDLLAAVRHGVWETVLESHFSRIFHKDVFSTLEVFDREKGEVGRSTVLLTSKDDIRKFDVDNEFKELLENDLERGFSLIVPLASVEGSADYQVTGWWRVNSKTGDTLGMIYPGWGGIIPKEYMDTQIVALVQANSVKAVGAWLKCETIWSYVSVYAEVAPVGEAGSQLLDSLVGLPAWIQLIISAAGIASLTASMQSRVPFVRECIKVVYRLPGP